MIIRQEVQWRRNPGPWSVGWSLWIWAVLCNDVMSQVQVGESWYFVLCTFSTATVTFKLGSHQRPFVHKILGNDPFLINLHLTLSAPQEMCESPSADPWAIIHNECLSWTDPIPIAGLLKAQMGQVILSGLIVCSLHWNPCCGFFLSHNRSLET